MEFLSAFESFQRQTPGGETPCRYQPGAFSQGAFKASPGFLVEFGGQAQSVLAQLWFVGFERCLQMRPDGVGFRSEFFYPLVHHLRVSKCAQPPEKFARNLAHRWP